MARVHLPTMLALALSALALDLALDLPLPAATGASRALAAEAVTQAIKPGRWEFTSQLQMPAGVALPAGVQLPAGGGAHATHTGCIEADKAVPTDPRPECHIDRITRDGAVITWVANCTESHGVVHSAGVARYSGDRMEGTLTTRLPQPGGKFIDTTQTITGRYLGACTH